MGHSVHNLLTPSVHNLMTLTVHEVLTLHTGSPEHRYQKPASDSQVESFDTLAVSSVLEDLCVMHDAIDL